MKRRPSNTRLDPTGDITGLVLPQAACPGGSAISFGVLSALEGDVRWQRTSAGCPCLWDNAGKNVTVRESDPASELCCYRGRIARLP